VQGFSADGVTPIGKSVSESVFVDADGGAAPSGGRDRTYEPHDREQ